MTRLEQRTAAASTHAVPTDVDNDDLDVYAHLTTTLDAHTAGVL